ncbi:AraC family transcriptional regulator [Arenibacter sp. M-2]|uniref:helix-turn-helix transcriptional regulator n=1 Tax=Arenibacter sp. M-2 TaxID=3053612 RepID=UPI002571162B|nr:AraC family transcriptional regulator [Arenibacter sp. M-2]MDL5511102.1 AraC family transcriptional regulator [Arenibacter sp. M-2]
MGYKMRLGAETVSLKNNFFSNELSKSMMAFKDETISLELKNLSLNHFHLIHGKQIAKANSSFSINFSDSFYATHFVLKDKNPTKKRTPSALNTYSAYYQDEARPETGLVTQNHEYEFLELAIRESFFEKLINEDDPLANRLQNIFCKTGYETTPKYPIRFEMYQCITALNYNIFSGSLQQLFIETKAAELLLLQVQSFNNNDGNLKLRSRDIDCLYDVRTYIEQNYATSFSIVDLAQQVGINQTKLKKGFKELFGTTIFGYLRDYRMTKAKHMLLDEKLYVGEVADRIGYRHPHHFTAAFKRKYGVLPSELKND